MNACGWQFILCVVPPFFPRVELQPTLERESEPVNSVLCPWDELPIIKDHS